MEVSKEILNQIADSLEAGEKCFIHAKTLEIVTYPDDYLLDIDPDNNAWEDDIAKVDGDKSFIEIEKMNSQDSFIMMEDFANSVVDRTLKIRLLTALEGRKPFANFKHQLENSPDFRELWFQFRREKNIEWVNTQLRFVHH
jgi:hypothetical protein